MSTDREKIDSFLQSRKDEVQQKTIDYVKAVLAIEKEINELKKEIKTLSDEAKEEQINTVLAKRAIARLKYLMKNSDDIIEEESEILDFIKSDGSVVSDVSELVKKQ